MRSPVVVAAHGPNSDPAASVLAVSCGHARLPTARRERIRGERCPDTTGAECLLQFRGVGPGCVVMIICSIPSRCRAGADAKGSLLASSDGVVVRVRDAALAASRSYRAHRRDWRGSATKPNSAASSVN